MMMRPPAERPTKNMKHSDVEAPGIQVPHGRLRHAAGELHRPQSAMPATARTSAPRRWPTVRPRAALPGAPRSASSRPFRTRSSSGRLARALVEVRLSDPLCRRLHVRHQVTFRLDRGSRPRAWCPFQRAAASLSTVANEPRHLGIRSRPDLPRSEHMAGHTLDAGRCLHPRASVRPAHRALLDHVLLMGRHCPRRPTAWLDTGTAGSSQLNDRTPV